MNRSEHLAWAKVRALEYVADGDLIAVFSSMSSDLSKHPDLVGHAGIELGMVLLLSGHLAMPEQMRDWITGFN